MKKVNKIVTKICVIKRTFCYEKIKKSNSIFKNIESLKTKLIEKHNLIDILQYVYENKDNLYIEISILEKNKKEYQEFINAYIEYREYVFGNGDKAGQIFFWDNKKRIKIKNFINNIVVRLNYFISKEFKKKQYIYPGKDLTEIVNIINNEGWFIGQEANIYNIHCIAEIEKIKIKKYIINILVCKEKEIDLLKNKAYEQKLNNYIYESNYEYNPNIEIEKGIILSIKNIDEQKIKNFIEYVKENYNEETYEKYIKKKHKFIKFLYTYIKIYNSCKTYLLEKKK